MAKIELWYKQDLKKPVPVRRLERVFNQDALGHLLGVEVFSDGEAVTLAGSVTGYCLLADGTTIPVAGTRSSNKASIIIPQAAYSVIGPITITVKLTEGDAITTLLAAVGMVARSRTGQQVDPGQTITDWTNQIAEALQDVEDASAAQDAKIGDLEAAFDEVDEIVRGEPNYTRGNYITSGDVLTPDSGYNVSEYIPIDSGSTAFYYGTYSNKIMILAYNSSKEKLDYWGGSSGQQYRVIALPANTAYVRFSYNADYIGKIMRGSVVKWESGYVGGIDEEFAGIDERIDSVSDSVQDVRNNMDSIAEDKTVSGIILPTISSVTFGYVGTNGTVVPDPSTNVYYCNRIPVNTGDVLTRTSGSSFRFVTAYNGETAVSASGATNTASYTVPDGIDGVIISISGAGTQAIADSQFAEIRIARSETKYSVIMDDTLTSPFYPPSAEVVGENIKGAGQARTLMGHERVTVLQNSVSANAQLEITDFPAFLKKSHGYSFSASFSTFTKLIIGQGYHQNLGRWLEIDGTEINVWSKADGSERVVGTVEHGLTFRDQINISLMIGDTGTGHFIMTTIPDPSNPTVCKYTRDFNFGEQVQGIYFAVGSQAMTNVIFSAVSPDLKKPLWIFGDSYLSIYDNRIGGQLKNYGYLSGIMVDAYPGNNSSNEYAELTKALALAKPRFLLWCVGMNDDSADDYQDTMESVKELCEANDITLILYRVPTVASKKVVLESISSIVIRSNLRYIDAYQAVETDPNGNWANGTLTSGDIHPTELGAQLIAQRYLIDVPEIMEC